MIYIMAHKAFDAPQLPGYVPLQVGAALHDGLGWLRDDAGENISAKNPYFCELTGLYWIWKNRDDAVKGLVHYRRYFTRSRMTADYGGVLRFDALSKALDRADLVAPRLKHNHVSVLAQFVPRHAPMRYFKAMRESVQRLYPEYLPDFDAVFAGNAGYYMNMLVAPRERFDAYCEWLFAILFDVEERAKAMWPEDDPKRVYGYLAERLLYVYVRHNHLRVAERPYSNLEANAKKRLRAIRREYTNRIRFPIWKRRNGANG